MSNQFEPNIAAIFRQPKAQIEIIVSEDKEPSKFRIYQKPLRLYDAMGINVETEAYTKINIIPSKIVAYNQFFNRVNFDTEKVKQPDDNSTNGILSDKAKSRIRKAIDWIGEIAKSKYVWVTDKNGNKKQFWYRLTFVTVELPSMQIETDKTQIHTDKLITNYCLGQLIYEMKIEYGLNYYIWKAEKQKNGNIHYHITTDIYIPHKELRERWCRIIEKLGYVSRYRTKQLDFYKDGFKVREDLLYKQTKNGKILPNWTEEKQLKSYNKEMSKPEAERWWLPNCTDIHSVKGIHNLKGYIAGYFCKNELEEEESEELKNLKIKQKDVLKNVDNKDLFSELTKEEEERIKELSLKCVDGRLWYLSHSLSNISLSEVVTENETIIKEFEIAQNKETTLSKTIDHNLMILFTGAFKKNLKECKSINKLLQDKIVDLREKRKRLITCKEIDFVFFNEFEQTQAFENEYDFNNISKNGINYLRIDLNKVFHFSIQQSYTLEGAGEWIENELADFNKRTPKIKEFKSFTETKIKDDLVFTFKSMKEYNDVYKLPTVKIDREMNEHNIKKFCVAWFVGEPAPLLYKTFETVNLKCGKHQTPFKLVSIEIDKKTSNFLFNLKKI